MIQEEHILDIYESSGALQKGHFVLSSGKHSSVYLQSAKVLSIPKYLKLIGQELANKIKKRFQINNINLIVAPAMGGVVIGSKVGECLDIKTIFLERVDGVFSVRRGFEINKNDNVIIIEDVVTSGKSSLECSSCIKENGGNILGLASIVDRSIKKPKFDFPFLSLLRINAPIYEKANVPDEIRKLPISKPGSRELK